jgi:hypothetical protein
LAIGLFVTDLKRGTALVAETSRRLPSGPLMLVRPLRITQQTEVEAGLWHLTAVGETAPGREWLLEEFAPKVLKELDDESKRQVLENEPIARDADRDADDRMIRTINNARKSPLEHGYLPPLASKIESTIGSTLKRTSRSVTRRNKSSMPTPKSLAARRQAQKTVSTPAFKSTRPARQKYRKIQ